ncbi:MAG: arginine deiminase family protein [Bacteroidetes bacterium]|nr:arginine deiminase family protein [Bacteroidota bacterium]
MSTENAIKIYHDDVKGLQVNNISSRTEPLKVLMCSPTYFDIIDVKNAHMEGQSGKLDKALAIQQWNDLKDVYETLKQEGIIEDVMVIEGVKGCEDMVFCANQTFPWLDKRVVISKMRHPSRQKEVPYFEDYFKSLGYQSIHLQTANMFEGMGDTIPHPQKRLLYGGFGHRSDPKAYKEISETLQVPIVTLELPNPNFYHLDTCFVPLSTNEVMLCKEAFTAVGLANLQQLFSKIYYIPESEAIDTFCLNAHVINNDKNGKKAAIMQKGSTHAIDALKQCGYKIYEIETSEYMKSGGSVFCMKMMFY